MVETWCTASLPHKIHLTGIQHAHIHLITKIAQMLIDSILNHLLDIGIHVAYNDNSVFSSVYQCKKILF